MKDYVGENQRILERWKEKFIEEFGADNEWKFAPDGIMNKGEFSAPDKNGVIWRERSNSEGTKENDLWSNAPLRVLFLTKDENLYDDSIVAWDVSRETFHAKSSKIEEYKASSSFFYKNEANILYGLLHTSPTSMMGFEEFAVNDAVRFSDEQIFARINCKKEGGQDTVTNSELYDTINKDYYFLKDQVLNFDADIFLCCGTQNDENPTLDFLYDIYKNEFVKCDYGTNKSTAVHYNEKRNKLALDIYHLAFSHSGGEKARYYEAIGAYYSFIKYLKSTNGVDFTKSHRQK